MAKRVLARCANCGKSTRYCASKGCKPVQAASKPEPSTVPVSPVYDAREVAQWFATGGYQIVHEALQALPASDFKRCFEYGSIVSWPRLPQSAKDIIAKRRAEIVANGERLQREIDARNDADAWPTCSECGSNLADGDDVENEICQSCKRDADARIKQTGRS